MPLSLVSWNINSVRLRIDQIVRFLSEQSPDIVAFQEIKCQTEEFPYQAIHAAGYPHIYVTGQKALHGVAIISRKPFEILATPDFCRRSEARSQAIRLEGMTLLNLYIPAGGDIPNRIENDKFDHKLEYYERLSTYLSDWPKKTPLMVLGDLNIAPGEFDVWSHKQMLRVVSHTPVELDAFSAMIKAGDLFDPFRETTQNPQKLFSWWSYRSADFRKSNRGLRLDHILLNPAVKQSYPSRKAEILDHVRAWEKPSDHAPIRLDLKL